MNAAAGELRVCVPCAVKLATIRDRDGEEAMSRAVSSVLCAECIAAAVVYNEELGKKLLREHRERLFCNHRGSVVAAPGGSKCQRCGEFFVNFRPA